MKLTDDDCLVVKIRNQEHTEVSALLNFSINSNAKPLVPLKYVTVYSTSTHNLNHFASNMKEQNKMINQIRYLRRGQQDWLRSHNLLGSSLLQCSQHQHEMS